MLLKRLRAKQKGGCRDMLLGTLGASLLRNILAGKGVRTVNDGVKRAGHGVNKAGQNF